jgi:hypothetical protein
MGLCDWKERVLEWLIGFIKTSLKLQSIVKKKTQQSITKTRSIPYWTTSVFSSTVTDLVLIYKLVIVSGFRFSLVNIPQLNSQLLNWVMAEQRLKQSSLHSRFYSIAPIHGKYSLLVRIHRNIVDSVDTESALRTKSVSTDTCVSESLPSSGQFQLSGVMSYISYSN